MALNVVSIKDELGVLKYFGQYAEITEQTGTGRNATREVVGIRYKLISYSGLGKEVIVNTNHKVPVNIAMGKPVKMINPVVHVGFQRIDNRVIPNAVIYADDLVVVNE